MLMIIQSLAYMCMRQAPVGCAAPAVAPAAKAPAPAAEAAAADAIPESTPESTSPLDLGIGPVDANLLAAGGRRRL